MEGIQIDWLVVVIATGLNMAIGFFWYSRWLFGPQWLKLSHLDATAMQGCKSAPLYGILPAFVTAFFLAFFEGYLGVTTVSDGMFVGFCAWLGFVATTQIASVIWCKEPFKLFLIHTGNRLLSYLVMGGIIGA